jgi:hypothetical protein
VTSASCKSGLQQQQGHVTTRRCDPRARTCPPVSRRCQAFSPWTPAAQLWSATSRPGQVRGLGAGGRGCLDRAPDLTRVRMRKHLQGRPAAPAWSSCTPGRDWGAACRTPPCGPYFRPPGSQVREGSAGGQRCSRPPAARGGNQHAPDPAPPPPRRRAGAFRAVARFNSRGAGRTTSKPACSRRCADPEASQLEAVARHILSLPEGAPTRLYVVGYSHGSCIAARALAQIPQVGLAPPLFRPASASAPTDSSLAALLAAGCVARG